jgi:hypothetical protein
LYWFCAPVCAFQHMYLKVMSEKPIPVAFRTYTQLLFSKAFMIPGCPLYRSAT